MSKNPQEHGQEYHYNKAKKEGYRARSAYKLIDLQNRFNIFKRSFYILDLGSAPGSWLQVAKKYAEDNIGRYKDQYYHRDHYKIMGVDTKNITPIEGIKVIKMDLTNPQFKNEIETYFNENQIDLIISDASINKSGNKFSDQSRQVNLCLEIIKLSKYLRVRGSLVVKLFQGADFDNFFKKMKETFVIVKSFKPRASNKKSNEIYLIGLKKK
ncbi:MAG: RlmE family RNA methyltransferase [Candidatus Lokiarchaeota archaeon]|nr:RlmE family RNA methyltransferase [Candidatus Lokiarchaeota archaeon]